VCLESPDTAVTVTTSHLYSLPLHLLHLVAYTRVSMGVLPEEDAHDEVSSKDLTMNAIPIPFH
jgi:hypothetical protein